MAQYYTIIQVQNFTTTGLRYCPFIERAPLSTPDYSTSFVMPFSGTLSFDLIARFAAPPGTVTLRLRKNLTATDLDTDTVVVGGTGPATFALSSGGWVVGDIMHLTIQQTTSSNAFSIFVGMTDE